MALAHTGKLQGLLKIVEHKFWEDREPLIMLEEPHLGCWDVTLRLVSRFWRLAVSSCGFGLSMELKEQTHHQVLQCDKNTRYRHHGNHRVFVRAIEQLIGQGSCCFIRILQLDASLRFELDLSDTCLDSCSGACPAGDTN